jgi:hypothetical protein
MKIINFAHPLTENNFMQIERLTQQKVDSVISIPSQFDPSVDFVPQVNQLIQSMNMGSHDWQTETILVNLPSLNTIAAVLLAELHGRMGYFPAILRLRAVDGAVPPQFEVAEIINLQSVRDAARKLRTEV